MLILLLAACSLVSCIKVEHLGSSTGKAFYEIFQLQARGKGRVKGMESELGAGVTKRMTSLETPEETSRQSRATLVRVGE